MRPRRHQSGSSSHSSDDVLRRIDTLERKLQQLERRLVQVEGPSEFADFESGAAHSLSSVSSEQIAGIAPLPTQAELQSGPSLLRGTDPRSVRAIWARYLTDIDPLLKLVDHQFVEDVLLTYPQPSAEGRALLSAIQFATEVCNDRISISMYETVSQTVETSFQAANVLTQPTVPKLQALTIYLTCGRVNMDQDYLCSSLSDLVRLSTILQLDRDPGELGYLPADCEHRRRLWWHIVSLDVRTAEACGTDLLIKNQGVKTNIPSMVRDASLRSNVIVESERHATCTVFAVAAIEMAELAKKFLFTGDRNIDPLRTQSSLDQSHQDLLDRHKAACRCVNSPICRLTAEWCKIYWARQSLFVRHWDKVFLKRTTTEDEEVHNEQAEKDLMVCVDILERVDGLRSHEDYSRWAWLWQNCVEWDISAIAMSTIASGHCSLEYVSRAWSAIDSFFAAWASPFGDPKHQKRWRELEVFRDWVRSSMSTVL